jgi:prepilin-type N-terminal cleavage/methylation domain-containing protein
MRLARGFTMLELLLVFTLLSVLLGLAAPSFLYALDVFSVRAARDTLLGAATRTRSLALARGRAYLHIQEEGVVSVFSPDTMTEFRRFDLQGRYDVSIDIENSARTAAFLEYDALGVGRLANLTVRLRRGRASGAVTFSAYGRPRVW